MRLQGKKKGKGKERDEDHLYKKYSTLLRRKTK
jgi:hypothetical protein